LHLQKMIRKQKTWLKKLGIGFPMEDQSHSRYKTIRNNRQSIFYEIEN